VHATLCRGAQIAISCLRARNDAFQTEVITYVWIRRCVR